MKSDIGQVQEVLVVEGEVQVRPKHCLQEEEEMLRMETQITVPLVILEPGAEGD